MLIETISDVKSIDICNFMVLQSFSDAGALAIASAFVFENGDFSGILSSVYRITLFKTISLNPPWRIILTLHHNS